MALTRGAYTKKCGRCRYSVIPKMWCQPPGSASKYFSTSVYFGRVCEDLIYASLETDKGFNCKNRIKEHWSTPNVLLFKLRRISYETLGRPLNFLGFYLVAGTRYITSPIIPGTRLTWYSPAKVLELPMAVYGKYQESYED
jgi:hypothetical protein